MQPLPTDTPTPTPVLDLPRCGRQVRQVSTSLAASSRWLHQMSLNADWV